MWEVFEHLMKQRGLRIIDVQRGTGIPYSTFTDWKAGRYTPKADKMNKIAAFFGVSVEYLVTGNDIEKESTEGNKYYFSDSTAQVAQVLYENKDMRVLFDAARDSKPEDLQMAADLLRRLKGTNPNG